MDRYRDRRSPDRERNRYSRDPPPTDTYVPSGGRPVRPRSRSPAGYRRRSRTPPRYETENWRGRPRSPPRRFDPRPDSYARDERPRSPRREYASHENAPYDDARALKRGREYSPRRSPQPPKRERLISPRREYGRPRSRSPVPLSRARSRSPRREERPDPYTATSWRRRSPSPRGSGRASAATSRRSSPRPRQPEPYPADTEVYDRRHESEYPTNGHGYDERDAIPADADYHGNGRSHAPPTGSGGGYRSSAMSPPAGPSSSAPVSMSAHNRPGSASILSAPSQPRGSYASRGGGPPSREYPREFASRPAPRHSSSSYGAPSSSGFARGPNPRESSYSARDNYPYDSRGGPPRHRDSTGQSFNPPFRGSSNSTSTTYPRTQRFNQALSDMPQAKPGGEKRPELFDTTKADRLEEEAAKLRKLIDEKEAQKRKGLQEWEKLEREAGSAQLKSELAEGHLRQLNGEESSVAF